MSEFPAGWARAPIGALCSLENGRAFKPSEWRASGVPIVRIQNLNNRNATYNYFEGEFADRYHLKGGELLFAWSGTPGTSFGTHVWQGGEAVLNQHIFRIDFDESFLDKRFFRYAINQKLAELIDIAHGGVGLRHVTKGKFENTEVTIPPLLEQKRIADKLDVVLARVDACRDRLDRVPAILKRFRQSVLAAATSGKLTEEWRDEHRESNEYSTGASRGLAVEEPYKLSPSWRWMALADITTNFDGRRVPVKASDRAVRQGPYKYYGAFGAIDNIDAFLFDGEFLLLAEDGKNLESRDRPISLVANGKFWVNNYAHVMQTKSKISVQYLNSWLNSSALDLSTFLTGIDQVKLTRGAMDRIPVPVAPLSEQHEIVRRVESLFAYADRLEARYAAARAQIERLTPALLAKAFCGELVPQDPNDEPASMLLERIRALGVGRNKRSVSGIRDRRERPAALSRPTRRDS